MEHAEQIPLALPHRPALGREDFLIAECNAEAIEWLDSWPNWPGCGLIVYGQPACGKTHLARVWQEKSGAAYFDATNLVESDSEAMLTAKQPLVVDNADRIDSEELLFHVYNTVFNAKMHVLLTAEKPPKLWGIDLKDLQSRLLSLPSVEVKTPDEGVLAAVFIKQLADRQLPMEDGVVYYLLPRMERSFKAVADLVDSLDQAALSQKRRITVPLAREVLQRMQNDG